ncbi:calpain-12 [Podarcis lilfordi]|uniref:Calpain-12 n=1 Tax=Podarcis lilfordi TaxID=74358 RepID=A0AA35KNS2_9SAUR|nr:calpain-12 [Podarcis lilfordi]
MASSGITICLEKDDAKAVARVLPYGGQDYGELKRQCLQQGSLFVDPDFKPSPESLGYNKLGPGSKGAQGVVWQRPKDICKPKLPCFICEGMNRTDVRQGELGDCWFLAAAASLTLYPHLLHRVVPQSQSFETADYAGIFHFQFWQYGQWVDVVVDDFLPTVNGKLIFVRSEEKDEFWMPLLEKAYAKLNGSYEGISLGMMNEAFVDFTGGVGTIFLLKTPNPELFKIIREALKRRSMMGASIMASGPEETELETPEKLLKGHAYSITGFRKVHVGGQKVKLLRLRNPWGRVEWNGSWSDTSPLWSYVDPGLREQLHVKQEDGEFWMQLSDFVHHFDILEICHFRTDGLEGESSPSGWYGGDCFQGSWVKGHTAGGHRTFNPWDTFWMNPQFHLSLLEPDEKQRKKQNQLPHPSCSLLVSLTQKDRRRSNKGFLCIGYDIFQMSEEYLQLKSTAQRKQLLPKLKQVWPTAYGYLRDITEYIRLPPGDYLIVTSLQNPLAEAEFTIRVFTEKKHRFREIGEEVSADDKALQIISPRIEFDQVLEKTFLEWAGQDQQMGAAELRGILNQVMKTTWYPLKTDGFSMEQCEKITQHFSGSKTGKLTLSEVKQFWTKITEWESIFIGYDMDRSGTMNTHEMQLALDTAGFHLNTKTREALAGRYGNSWLQMDFDNFVSLMVHLESIFRQCKSWDADDKGQICMTEQKWMDLVMST